MYYLHTYFQTNRKLNVLLKREFVQSSQDIETEKPSQLARKENFKFEYKYFKNLINAYHITFLKSRSFHFLKN